ncbi:MAG: electron transfer flavoprotein subunit alpha/FixB family protein [Acidimicrobiaceae bacterium]|nr:electron transfer flavoprotein subunit alpha/FixB family protein [Acidimicrobiaceae bacterium]
MTVLVFLEHDRGAVLRGPLGVLSKAATLGAGEVAAVICGDEGLDAAAEQAGAFGADRVYLARDPGLNQPLPQPRVDAVAEVARAKGHDTVLFSTSVLAADVAGGLAARLGAGINWDLTDLAWRDGEPVGTRRALQDSVLAEVGWRSAHRIALFRPGAFEANPVGSGSPVIEDVAVSFQEHSAAVQIVSQERPPEGEGAAIEDAEVIVAGGMGLGGPEHFALAEQLAGVLGGAVGATRAAVYAGWYPRSAQVGQTGKTVTPKLYVALGISGAIQHKVGMQGSKVIVAINKDPAAPIFESSDLAVVGDVHAIVPRLTELLEQRKPS